MRFGADRGMGYVAASAVSLKGWDACEHAPGLTAPPRTGIRQAICTGTVLTIVITLTPFLPRTRMENSRWNSSR